MTTMWNVFAAELLAMLQEKDPSMDWFQLEKKAGIHPQKIQRLRESLDYQGQFPVLSELELPRVSQAFGLEEQELRLRAAILATGVEAKLLPRIGARSALQAAEILLPIIHQALIDAENDDDNPLNVIRFEGVLVMSPLVQRFAEALAHIDRGTLALYEAHTTEHTTNVEERQGSLRQAREDFTQALTILNERADTTTRQDTIWQAWRDEAQNGLQEAQQ
jgi:hypothetical protein